MIEASCSSGAPAQFDRVFATKRKSAVTGNSNRSPRKSRVEKNNTETLFTLLPGRSEVHWGGAEDETTHLVTLLAIIGAAIHRAYWAHVEMLRQMPAKEDGRRRP